MKRFTKPQIKSSFTIILWFGFLIYILSFSEIALAQNQNAHSERYMLCVGINNYTNSTAGFINLKDRGKLSNLHGCLNDVDTISKTFIKYYQFKNENITKLLDQQASKQGIINELKKAAEKCNPGDVMVFFYSGHGSCEQTDEMKLGLQKTYINTLVPADIRNEGVTDLNNLELNELFLAFTKKKVRLTVITDACHSATITRGQTLFDPTEDVREVATSFVPFHPSVLQLKATTPLTEQGAVTIGACQDFELAQELTLNNVKYGALAISLCEAIAEFSKAPIEDLFKRTVTKMKFYKKTQVPNMEFALTRLNMNLPGTAPGEIRKASYGIENLAPTKDTMEIAGGFLDGVFVNDILVDKNSKDSIRVITIIGPNRSQAKLINQSKNFKSSLLQSLQFSLLKAASNPDPVLKVYLGDNISDSIYDDILSQVKTISTVASLNWVRLSLKEIPQAILYYNNVESSIWKLNMNNTAVVKRFSSLQDNEIETLLKGKKAFIQIPPQPELRKTLKQKIEASQNRNIKIVKSATDADYILSGEYNENSVKHGWISTHLQTEDSADFPVVTDFFSIKEQADSLLQDRIVKLSKLANWFTLNTPSENSLHYPFTVIIKKTSSKNSESPSKLIRTVLQDTLLVDFDQDIMSKEKWNDSTLFIYIFSIDPKGNMRLIFPNKTTSIFAYPRGLKVPYLALLKHTTPGKYHYFLLATKERINNTAVFNQQGVVTRSETLSDNPLEDLINDSGMEKRGEIKTFNNWLIKRVDVLTSEKTAAIK